MTRLKNIENVTRCIGIADRQKAGKQGRNDSIKLFSILSKNGIVAST